MKKVKRYVSLKESMKRQEYFKDMGDFSVSLNDKNEWGLLTITHNGRSDLMSQVGYDFLGEFGNKNVFFTSDENGDEREFRDFEKALKFYQKKYNVLVPLKVIKEFKKIYGRL